MKITYRQESTLLILDISGPWTASGMHEAIGAARAEADKRKCRNLLVDAREISFPDTEATRFFSGERWAKLFDARFRAAFIVRPALYNGVAELVARNRGANVAVFFEDGPARKWLDEERA